MQVKSSRFEVVANDLASDSLDVHGPVIAGQAGLRGGLTIQWWPVKQSQQ
jgi:hypothetical protein